MDKKSKRAPISARLAKIPPVDPSFKPRRSVVGAGLVLTPRESLLQVKNEIDNIVKKEGTGIQKSENTSPTLDECVPEHRRSRNMTQVYPARSGNFVIDIILEDEMTSNAATLPAKSFATSSAT